MTCETVIRLKQETPYIHFQHYEKGATLRATEVKPKLDKFLVEKLGGEKNINEEWFVKSENNKKALNYKLKFAVQGINTVSQEINKMYFGNLGRENKKSVFAENLIEMKVICFIPKLMEEICKYVQEFFVVENFGTRQSKGFGGFVVHEENCNYDANKVNELLGDRLYFFCSCDKSSQITTMLEHAQTISAILKGGINETKWIENEKKYKNDRLYIKSYIQRAFLDKIYGKDYGSEKACIKSFKEARPKDPRESNDSKDRKYDNYVFMRAVLGLPDCYRFTDLRRGKVNIYSLGENDFDICRFKSPITIKIIGNLLYFIFDVNSLKSIKNKTFYFVDEDSLSPSEKELLRNRSHKKYQKKKNLIQSHTKIKTPMSFGKKEVKELISGFVDYFNNDARKKLAWFPNFYRHSQNLELLKCKKIVENC